jgi:hypothetical protein
MNNKTMEKARNAPRCGAKARTTGKPCLCPAMPNGRCRLHGGKSTGAPTGKANGNYKNGLRTKRSKQFKKTIRAVKAAIRQGNHWTASTLIDELELLLNGA